MEREKERERECGREKAGRAGQVDILGRAAVEINPHGLLGHQPSDGNGMGWPPRGQTCDEVDVPLVDLIRLNINLFKLIRILSRV